MDVKTTTRIEPDPTAWAASFASELRKELYALQTRKDPFKQEASA